MTHSCHAIVGFKKLLREEHKFCSQMELSLPFDRSARRRRRHLLILLLRSHKFDTRNAMVRTPDVKWTRYRLATEAALLCAACALIALGDAVPCFCVQEHDAVAVL